MIMTIVIIDHSCTFVVCTSITIDILYFDERTWQAKWFNTRIPELPMLPSKVPEIDSLPTIRVVVRGRVPGGGPRQVWQDKGEKLGGFTLENEGDTENVEGRQGEGSDGQALEVDIGDRVEIATHDEGTGQGVITNMLWRGEMGFRQL